MHALELWLKGLIAAPIGGGANAVTMLLVDPEHFNIHDGINQLTKVVAIGALISVAGYLKSSPLLGVQVHPEVASGAGMPGAGH